MPDADTIVAAFDDAGYRVTEPRRSLARLIGERGGHFTAEQLVAASRSQRLGVGRATVFRTLDLLVEMGLAKRFEGDGHVYLYTSCEPVHHHHLVCRTCGSTTDIDDAEVDALIYSMRRRHDFVLDHGSLDFYGTCARCSSGR